MTMKCNLDCSYCGTGLYGGHDNSTSHPPLDQCLESVDFMLEYADIYMSHKPRSLKHVILNVYGGEALLHPDILAVLDYVQQRRRHYADRWDLTVTTTTNLIIPEKKLNQIIPYIDEFTISYHTESSLKHRNRFRENALLIRDSGKRVKCVIIMHNQPDLWQDATDMVSWCETNGVKHLAKQIDSHGRYNYEQQQIQWFDRKYNEKSWKTEISLSDVEKDQNDRYNLSGAGRACCGGRQLCQDQSYRQRHGFVKNYFPDWYCSVNEFFLFVKQITREVFVNKDCKMDFNGSVGAIGTLDDKNKLLNWTRDMMDQDTMPVIQCKKKQCFCGLCAPKAKHAENYKSIMEKYRS